MKTSYFANLKNLDTSKTVSIALKCPDWYHGKEDKRLAPKWWFLKKYKEDHDETFYTEQFYKEILDLLDPKEIYEELKDSVLLCYEKRGDFCHRRLVAEWFEKALDVKVPEL